MPPFAWPRWLPPEAPLPLSGEVERVLAHLERDRRGLTVVGGPGAGKTSVLGGVAARTTYPVVAARLAGCQGASDIVLVLGFALGAPVPGDETIVGRTLAAQGAMVVLLDDADVPGMEAVEEELGAMAPDARWLYAGERAAVTGATLQLPRRSAPAVEDDAQGVAPMLRQALSALPAGIRTTGSLPPAILLPSAPGWLVLRRSARRELRPYDERPVQVVSSSCADLAGLAVGGTVPGGLEPADLFALRWLALEADSETGARMAASAARLLVTWGQSGAARSLLEDASLRQVDASPGARALLRWAEARALLLTAGLTEASRSFESACALLRQARELGVLASITRQWADLLLACGDGSGAASFYRQARALYRSTGQTAGIAATLRGAGDLAVFHGETVSAEALYEQSDVPQAGPVEATNRRLGQAVLHIKTGRLQEAAQLLATLPEPTENAPLLKANIERVRAELALRSGDTAAAGMAAERALAIYDRLGERMASGRIERLRGDAHAIAGRPMEAARAYERAIEILSRARDLLGLDRVLRHAALLERSLGDGDTGRDLQALADEARSLVWSSSTEPRSPG